jgi:2-polyprenyl-3-methyl-5-hydroxy-6-metoxy-1,4-benzoquinol methylase
MDCIPITECIACGSKALVPVLDLGFQPLANSYLKDKHEVEQEFPLAIDRCTSCYHVQLTHQVNPELMFKDYAYVSGTAQTQLDYFNWLVGHITHMYGSTPKTILDIGCNDGSFLNAWGGTGATTYGVDPAENLYPVSSKDHNVHCGFFTGKEYPGIRFDVITCLNAFAHNANQLELLINARDRLSEKGLIFCSTSQADMILNGEFDTIYHEHYSYLSAHSVRAIAIQYGFKLVHVDQLPTHGGSNRYWLSRSMPVDQTVAATLENELNAGLFNSDEWHAFETRSKKAIDGLRQWFLERQQAGDTVVGYGAAHKGNTFLNAVGDAAKILKYVVDASSEKQGKFLPGSQVPVLAPERLASANPSDVLILPWNIAQELAENIRLLAPNSRIWVAQPMMRQL